MARMFFFTNIQQECTKDAGSCAESKMILRYFWNEMAEIFEKKKLDEKTLFNTGPYGDPHLNEN